MNEYSHHIFLTISYNIFPFNVKEKKRAKKEGTKKYKWMLENVYGSHVTGAFLFQ